jgi:hypothetical protein
VTNLGSEDPNEVAEDVSRLVASLADRYAIEREAGRGGMAIVYRARDLRHQRPVALKVVRASLAGQGLTRFRREIELAANLQHPHILPVFDSGEAAGRLWYTMPFVEGESLGDRLRRERRLGIADAVRVLREMADALDHAHARRVVHRDLKPDNVLLSGEHAMIADFGVAKALIAATHAGMETTDGSTAVGVSVGTPAYMAPEQAAADPAVDHRADLYALGVIGYQLLTGVTPFAGTTPQAQLAAHLSQQPQPLSTHRGDVPPALERLIMQLLEKDAARRPRSAAAVVAELDGISAAATPVLTSRARASGAWRRPAMFLALAAVAVIVAGASWWYMSTRRVGTGVVLVVPFENQTGDTSLAPVGRTTAGFIASQLANFDFLDVPEPPRTSPTEAKLRDAAATSHATLVVTGTYTLDGDSIGFHPTIIEVEGWKVSAAVGDVRSPRSNASARLDSLAQRVMAAVARRVDPRMRGWRIAAASTYEAMNEFNQGLDFFTDGRPAEAVPHWERAAKLDSTYAQPRLHLLYAYDFLQDDILLKRTRDYLQQRRASLTPVDRAMLVVSLGEVEDGYTADEQSKAAEAMHNASPGDQLPWFFMAGTAARQNRSHAVLAAIQHVHAEYGRWYESVWSANMRWVLETTADHMLRDYEAELKAATRARRLVPRSQAILWWELRALAALGRANELKSKLDTLESMPTAPLWDLPTPDLLLALANELDVHGDTATARELRLRSLERLRRQPTDSQSRSGWRLATAQAEYYLGHYDRADSLLGRDSSQLAYLQYQGLVAAHLHRPADANRVAKQLETFSERHDRGQTTLARAEIAAALGDTATAVSLVEQAIAQGLRVDLSLHPTPDLAPIRNDPRVLRLLEPKP